MIAKVIKVGRIAPKSAIAEAAEVLKSGGLVVYPTDTVYGLGADALSDEAVARVFMAKARPLESPISIAVSSIEMAREIAELTPAAEALFKKFTPGPITIIVKAKSTLSTLLTASTGKIGIRIPDQPIALKLIDSFKNPITTTSANISGRPSPTTVKDALKQLKGKVDIALDAGKCRIGVPSTVVDASSTSVKVLREGPISKEEIEKAVK